MSPRWIYVADQGMHENLMIFVDDYQMDEEIAAMFR